MSAEVDDFDLDEIDAFDEYDWESEDEWNEIVQNEIEDTLIF